MCSFLTSPHLTLLVQMHHIVNIKDGDLGPDQGTLVKSAGAFVTAINGFEIFLFGQGRNNVIIFLLIRMPVLKKFIQPFVEL